MLFLLYQKLRSGPFGLDLDRCLRRSWYVGVLVPPISRVVSGGPFYFYFLVEFEDKRFVVNREKHFMMDLECYDGVRWYFILYTF